MTLWIVSSYKFKGIANAVSMTVPANYLGRDERATTCIFQTIFKTQFLEWK